MVLEATVVCLDNSEWMRNGDFPPNRLEAQHDAVQMICGSKIQDNPENTVSAMTMAGKCDMAVTLTNDLGKILTSISNVKINGTVNLRSALQIAQLALKHRQNKHQRQRIVVFVGSPLDVDEAALVKVAKKLKKNNVSVDVINFGEEGLNSTKLEAFVNTVNNNEGSSHLVTVPAGPHLLSDVVVSSPIVAGEGMAGATPTDASQFEFGVDPSLDPELAMALRMSVEEERLRQERARREAEAAQEARNTQDTASQSQVASTSVATSEDLSANKQQGTAETNQEVRPMDVDSAEWKAESSDGQARQADNEQALLAQAIAMSMQSSGGDRSMDGSLAAPVDMPALSEDQQIELAMQMSMLGSAGPSERPGEQGDIDFTQNRDFLSSVLEDLPGVNTDDAAIRNLMGDIGKGKNNENDSNESESPRGSQKKKGGQEGMGSGSSKDGGNKE